MINLECLPRRSLSASTCASKGRGRHIFPTCRRDGRVAEGARLESVFTRKGNVGSNPTLSAMQSGLQRNPALVFCSLRELRPFFAILARQTGPRRMDCPAINQLELPLFLRRQDEQSDFRKLDGRRSGDQRSNSLRIRLDFFLTEWVPSGLLMPGTDLNECYRVVSQLTSGSPVTQERSVWLPANPSLPASPCSMCWRRSPRHRARVNTPESGVPWNGIAPDGSLLIMRDVGNRELYSLELQLP